VEFSFQSVFGERFTRKSKIVILVNGVTEGEVEDNKIANLISHKL